MPTTPDKPKVTRHGLLRIEILGDTNPEKIIDALHAQGELLKQSHKSATFQVGDWVVKRSLFNGGVGPLKHTFYRERYRQGWKAAQFLGANEIPIATPRAFIEIGVGGIILGNIMISDYLDGYLDLREYAQKIADDGPEIREAFFDALAQAVNGLLATGAYHTDFSWKNILTKDGQKFVFIDLDGVVLDQPYTDEARLINHYQLLHDIYDCWSMDALAGLVERLLPQGTSLEQWMPRVVEGLDLRIANHLKVQQKLMRWPSS